MPDWPTSEVRTLLAKFGLTADHVLRPARTLSPGERTRAALALLQARGVNVLVLDEPTNHLDLPAIEQLEEALAAYHGTLLLVTHDRRMLESVSTTRRLEVSDGKVTELPYCATRSLRGELVGDPDGVHAYQVWPTWWASTIRSRSCPLRSRM